MPLTRQRAAFGVELRGCGAVSRACVTAQGWQSCSFASCEPLVCLWAGVALSLRAALLIVSEQLPWRDASSSASCLRHPAPSFAHLGIHSSPSPAQGRRWGSWAPLPLSLTARRDVRSLICVTEVERVFGALLGGFSQESGWFKVRSYLQ